MPDSRAYIYRSHAIVTYRHVPGPGLPAYYTFEIDGVANPSSFASGLAASDAAEAVIDSMIEDGPAVVGDVWLPSLEMGGDA